MRVIQLKARHFKTSPGFYSDDCPIAMALKEELPKNSDVYVGVNSVTEVGKVKKKYSLRPRYLLDDYISDINKVTDSTPPNQVIREVTMYEKES